MMSVIKAAKCALRLEMENKLNTLSQEEIQRQSRIVKEKLFCLDEFQKSKRVSVFLSTASEVDTEPIIRKMFEEEKLIFVPRYSKSGMDMVKLHSMEDWENLPLTKWNIKQPLLKDTTRENALDGGLDLVITPGVAFTIDGWRLGHGGGYYDRYLYKLQQTQPVAPYIVAVAFKEQIVDEIPTERTDIQVDKVLYAE